MYNKLITEIKNNKIDVDLDKLNQAYRYTEKKLKDMYRENNDPVAKHAVQVAILIARTQLDETSIIAALLHEVAYQLPHCMDEIENKFGEEIAFLVLSFSYIKEISQPVDDTASEMSVLTHFLTSSTKDIRVLLIRLADKLNNLQTLPALPPNNQQNALRRAENVYSPLAEVVGVYFIKRQLDDLILKYRQPKTYRQLKIALHEYYQEAHVEEIQEKVTKTLKANNIDFVDIFSRNKSIASTYRKLKRYKKQKKIPSIKPDQLNHILDKMGITILTRTVGGCYTILGLIINMFSPLINHFDDYISKPKENGYRGLQIPVIVDENKEQKYIVEVQIKTKEMHWFNEYGPASHINYKLNATQEKGKDFSTSTLVQLNRWKKEAATPNKRFNINILDNKIFVFTKDHEVIVLPQGATALDFAYNIHTDVGNHCKTVYINKSIASFDSKLKTGDQVEILQSKKPNVNLNWLNLTITDKAHRDIRRHGAK